MADFLEVFYELIDRLDERESKRFKSYLSSETLDGFKAIPKAKLEKADATDIVNMMSQFHGQVGTWRITAFILKKLNRMDLLEELRKDEFWTNELSE